MKIHPSAIVDANAQLGEDVEVGPFSIIGPLARIGSGTRLGSHVVIEGAVRIGSNNVIGPGSIIGGAPQDLGFDEKTRSAIVIGDENVLREYCTIHRGSIEGSSTMIGHKNFLMAGVHLGHNCKIGNGVIIANSVLLAGHVSIDDQAFIGGATTFHQNMRVGRLVMAQGSSAFGKDLPPFTLAAERNAVFGLNVIGMRRAGFTSEQRNEIKRAFKLLYLSGLNLRQVLERAAAEEWGEVGREFFDFVTAAGKRGVCRYHRDKERAAEES